MLRNCNKVVCTNIFKTFFGDFSFVLYSKQGKTSFQEEEKLLILLTILNLFLYRSFFPYLCEHN